MNGFLTTHTKGASVSISHHRELFQELLSTILCLPPYVVNVWMWMWIQASLRVYLDCSSFPCPSDCLIDCLLHAPLRSLIWPFFFSPLLYLFTTLFYLLISRKHMIPIPQFSSVQSLSRVWLFVTPWIAAHQASLSITNSWSSPKLMSMDSVMPSSHLILCHPLLLLPPIPPSIKVFSNESTLRMRWPKYWSFSFSISPSNEHPGLKLLLCATQVQIQCPEPSIDCWRRSG